MHMYHLLILDLTQYMCRLWYLSQYVSLKILNTFSNNNTTSEVHEHNFWTFMNERSWTFTITFTWTFTYLTITLKFRYVHINVQEGSHERLQTFIDVQKLCSWTSEVVSTTSDIQEYKKRIFMNVHERSSFLGTVADIRKRSRERSWMFLNVPGSSWKF